jgi:hypothetical protein
VIAHEDRDYAFGILLKPERIEPMRFIIALLMLTFPWPAPAEAQNSYHAGGERECREPVKSAGDAFHVIHAAKASAIKRWQEQVFGRYGDRFTTLENARGPEGGDPIIHCDPARVGGGNTIFDLKRCVVVARPCRSAGTRD